MDRRKNSGAGRSIRPGSFIEKRVLLDSFTALRDAYLFVQAQIDGERH